MEYILRHKEYKTYYCFRWGYKEFKTDVELAKVFKRKSDADRIRKKFKHPENWEIIERKV